MHASISSIAVDGLLNLVEAFEIDQPSNIVTFGETFGRARFVLVHATNKIIGYTNVKCAADAIGKYVDIEDMCSH
jgi:hypothetical protein